MSRFPLDGLLRLRRVQDDVAAAALGSAVTSEQDAALAVSVAELRVSERVRTDGASAGSTSGTAFAHGRLRSGALACDLLDAAAAVAAATAEVERRREAWGRARAARDGVETLRDEHEAAERAELQHQEQLATDDLVVARWALRGRS